MLDVEIEFMGEVDSHLTYCVGGSHIFEIHKDASAAEKEKIAEVFEAWAIYLKAGVPF